MRRLGYGLGIVLLIIGAATGQLFAMLARTGYQPVSIGSIWYAVHGNSLVGFQALVEKQIGPEVWPPIQYLLTLPAWATLGLPGLLLVLTCRGRRSAFD